MLGLIDLIGELTKIVVVVASSTAIREFRSPLLKVSLGSLIINARSRNTLKKVCHYGCRLA